MNSATKSLGDALNAIFNSFNQNVGNIPSVSASDIIEKSKQENENKQSDFQPNQPEEFGSYTAWDIGSNEPNNPVSKTKDKTTDFFGNEIDTGLYNGYLFNDANNSTNTDTSNSYQALMPGSSMDSIQQETLVNPNVIPGNVKTDSESKEPITLASFENRYGIKNADESKNPYTEDFTNFVEDSLNRFNNRYGVGQADTSVNPSEPVVRAFFNRFNNRYGLAGNNTSDAYDLIDDPLGKGKTEGKDDMYAGDPDMSLGEAYTQFFANNPDLGQRYGSNIGRLSTEADDLETWRRVLEDPNLKRFYKDDYDTYAGGRDTFTDEELQAWYDFYKPNSAADVINDGEKSRIYGLTDSQVQDAFLNYLIKGDYPGQHFEYDLGDEFAKANGFASISGDDAVKLTRYENAYKMFNDYLNKGEAEKWSEDFSDDDLAKMLELDPLYFTTQEGDGLVDLMSLDHTANVGNPYINYSQAAMDTYNVPFVGMSDTVRALAEQSGKDYYYALKKDIMSDSEEGEES